MQEKITIDGWKYLLENDAAYITGIPDIKGNVLRVPESLDGYSVEEIKFYFASVRDYNELILPKTLKYFDAICLQETIAAISVDPENENFHTEDGVLYSKDKKTIVAFPPAKKAFNDSYLAGVKIIGDGAFSCCDCIVELKIPDSVVEIGDLAFEGCERLNYIYIPNSVVSMGKGVFSCSSLKTVVLSKNIKNLDTMYGYDAEGEGFFEACEIANISLPDGVEYIGECTFNSCKKLKTVYIPASVKEIGDYAFSGCDSLEEVIVSEHNKNYYSKDGILFSKNGILIHYPQSKKEEIYTVQEDIFKIGKYSFYENKYLRKLIIGESVSTIERRAFACSHIEFVNIPSKVSRIEQDVFLYTNIKELYIPKTVQFIEMSSDTAGNINPFKDMKIIVDSGSYAEEVCIEKGLNVKTI